MNLGALIRIFGRIGILSFGGPAAQIALMHKELVETRPLLSEQQFLRALSFCMLLPGPEAMQLATYAGWRLRGITGGLIAGLLFVLPGAVVILALALSYASYGGLDWVQAVFLGIKSVVVIIVIEALLKISKRALKRPAHWAIALLSFVAIFVFSIPFPVIILTAGIIGAFLSVQDPPDTAAPVAFTDTLTQIAIWSAVWLLPLGLIYAVDPEFLGPLGAFFSKLAMVTFGGAYAVLAYMTQAVVGDLGWLTTAEMMDALGLAETTPGPLILVTEFVGILAGFREGGLGLALLAGLVTLWATFAPCFLWIFAGAPYIDWLASRPRLAAALGAITAAVVGVILNLMLWFALHLLFDALHTQSFGFGAVLLPELTSLQWTPALLALGAGYLMLVRHMNLIVVLCIGGLAGFATTLI
ncbi:MAG: chromate efflux transporter [Pseudomonadota bacterium]